MGHLSNVWVVYPLIVFFTLRYTSALPTLPFLGGDDGLGIGGAGAVSKSLQLGPLELDASLAGSNSLRIGENEVGPAGHLAEEPNIILFDKATHDIPLKEHPIEDPVKFLPQPHNPMRDPRPLPPPHQIQRPLPPPPRPFGKPPCAHPPGPGQQRYGRNVDAQAKENEVATAITTTDVKKNANASKTPTLSERVSKDPVLSFVVGAVVHKNESEDLKNNLTVQQVQKEHPQLRSTDANATNLNSTEGLKNDTVQQKKHQHQHQQPPLRSADANATHLNSTEGLKNDTVQQKDHQHQHPQLRSADANATHLNSTENKNSTSNVTSTRPVSPRLSGMANMYHKMFGGRK